MCYYNPMLHDHWSCKDRGDPLSPTRDDPDPPYLYEIRQLARADREAEQERQAKIAEEERANAELAQAQAQAQAQMKIQAAKVKEASKKPTAIKGAATASGTRNGNQQQKAQVGTRQRAKPWSRFRRQRRRSTPEPRNNENIASDEKERLRAERAAAKAIADKADEERRMMRRDIINFPCKRVRSLSPDMDEAYGRFLSRWTNVPWTPKEVKHNGEKAADNNQNMNHQAPFNSKDTYIQSRKENLPPASNWDKKSQGGNHIPHNTQHSKHWY